MTNSESFFFNNFIFTGKQTSFFFSNISLDFFSYFYKNLKKKRFFINFFFLKKEKSKVFSSFFFSIYSLKNLLKFSFVFFYKKFLIDFYKKKDSIFNKSLFYFLFLKRLDSILVSFFKKKHSLFIFLNNGSFLNSTLKKHINLKDKLQLNRCFGNIQTILSFNVYISQIFFMYILRFFCLKVFGNSYDFQNKKKRFVFRRYSFFLFFHFEKFFSSFLNFLFFKQHVSFHFNFFTKIYNNFYSYFFNNLFLKSLYKHNFFLFSSSLFNNSRKSSIYFKSHKSQRILNSFNKSFFFFPNKDFMLLRHLHLFINFFMNFFSVIFLIFFSSLLFLRFAKTKVFFYSYKFIYKFNLFYVGKSNFLFQL